MDPPSQKDLWLVLALSLVGLALIWLSPVQSYPFTLIPNLLLLFLPGYALVTAIKPHGSLETRIVIGFLLGLLLLIFLPITFTYLNLTFLNELIPTILFVLAILFSLVAIRRRRAVKDLEGQLTLDESIRRIQEIKKESEEIILSEMEEYTPMPAEMEEPSQKNTMSLMRLYDTGERPEADKPLEEKIKIKKPIRDDILRRKEEGKSGERTMPLPIEHPNKKDDLLTSFQKEMGKPVWLDHIDDDKSFRHWDLLLALLLSGLAVSFFYYDPLKTPLLTTITSYTVLLFTLAYTLLIVIFPDRRKIGLFYRFLASSLITFLLLTLILFLIMENSNVMTALPLPLILLLALATLLLVIMAVLRRRSLPESAELSLEEIIRRSEKMGILVEHDEETLKVLKELEKQTEEKQPEEKETTIERNPS